MNCLAVLEKVLCRKRAYCEIGQGPEGIQISSPQNIPLFCREKVRLTVIRRKPKPQNKPDSSLCLTPPTKPTASPVVPPPGQISNPAPTTIRRELATLVTQRGYSNGLELLFPQSINTSGRVIFSRCNSNHVSPLSKTLPCSWPAWSFPVQPSPDNDPMAPPP